MSLSGGASVGEVIPERVLGEQLVRIGLSLLMQCLA